MMAQAHTRQLRAALIITVLLALASTAGCNTSGCLENRNSVPFAGFYTATDSSVTAIKLDSLRVTGIGMPDSVCLCKEGTQVGDLYLPMRSTQQTTAWRFAYKWKALDYDALADTISFEYTSTPYFASEECGVIYIYDITGMYHTTHLIDSVVITDSVITNVDTERIKIYFRTSHEEEPEAADE